MKWFLKCFFHFFSSQKMTVCFGFVYQCQKMLCLLNINVSDVCLSFFILESNKVRGGVKLLVQSVSD